MDDVDRILRVRVTADGLPLTPLKNPWRCRALAGLESTAFGAGASVAYDGPPGGGTVPVVFGVSYGVVDTGGGGGRVVVEVDDSTGCTTIAAGGVAFTSFAIDDGTHVSGIPGAHVAGTVNVVVTNTTGDSTTGTGLIEYFKPYDLGPTLQLLQGDYAVTGVQGVNAVGTWTDSSGSGNNAVSSGVSCPVASSGVPDFVAGDALHLAIFTSIASGLTSPPDMAELTGGTQIAFFEPGSPAPSPSPDYGDAVIMVGTGASAGICFSSDGIAWEAYDETGPYQKTTAVAAAVGVKHFACARWSGDQWGCRANSGAFDTLTSGTSHLSNGNVGPYTELGRSYGGTQYYDGKEHCLLMFNTPLSDTNVEKIYQWGRQRGIAA